MTTHLIADGGTTAGGVLFLHAVPRALASHLEWALGKTLGIAARLDWTDQPLLAAHLRAEVLWQGPAGTGARIASALRAFGQARYEVTEDPSPGREGERFAVTPALGIFRATVGPHGDVMVSEERLRSALRAPDVAARISQLMGEPWDEELEPFRCAKEGSTVRLLHHAG